MALYMGKQKIMPLVQDFYFKQEAAGIELLQSFMKNTITEIKPEYFEGMTVCTMGGERVCYRNKYLTSVTLPDSITRCEGHSFSDCPNLVYVSLGKNISDRDYWNTIFNNCSKLTEVNFRGTIAEWKKTGVKINTGNSYTSDAKKYPIIICTDGAYLQR